MENKGTRRNLDEEQQVERQQELESPQKQKGFLGALVYLLSRENLERLVAEQRERRSEMPVEEPRTLTERLVGLFQVAPAQEQKFVLNDISGSETMLKPNPEYVPPPYDELQASLGSLPKQALPNVGQSQHIQVG